MESIDDDDFLALELEDEAAGPAIGAVKLKTVAVAPELPKAPGADVDPDASLIKGIEQVQKAKDDLFDRSDDVDLADAELEE